MKEKVAKNPETNTQEILWKPLVDFLSPQEDNREFDENDKVAYDSDDVAGNKRAYFTYVGKTLKIKVVEFLSNKERQMYMIQFQDFTQW